MNGRKNDSRESSQADKFRDAARELETDDREDAFDEKLRRITKTRKSGKDEPARDQD